MFSNPSSRYQPGHPAGKVLANFTPQFLLSSRLQAAKVGICHFSQNEFPISFIILSLALAKPNAYCYLPLRAHSYGIKSEGSNLTPNPIPQAKQAEKSGSHFGGQPPSSACPACGTGFGVRFVPPLFYVV